MPRPRRALIALLLVGARAGPDAGGLELVDSDEPAGPVAAVLPLGAADGLGLGPGGSTTVDLPFAFNWYGVDHTSLTVTADGGAFFTGATASPGCPGTGSVWSGFTVGQGGWEGGYVGVRPFGRYPRRALAVEWAGASSAGLGAGRAQLWLMEASDQALIQVDDLTFGDPAADGGAGGPWGAQGGAGTGLAWACAGGLVDGSAAWIGLPADRPGAALQVTGDLPPPWTGADAAQYAGEALLTQDANGDGLIDLWVGAGEVGLAWLVTGSTAAAGGSLAAATVRLVGDGDGLGLGTALASGDVDGDGVVDLIVGAPDADDAANGAGAVGVRLGGGPAGERVFPDDADLWLPGPSGPRPSASAGTWASPRAGTAVAVGDVDGDGLPDLVVGAPTEDSAATNAGAVFVLLDIGGWVPGAGTLDDADAVLLGGAPGERVGDRVWAADLDGDGLDDLLLGAPEATPPSGPALAGELLLVSGAALVPGDLDAATAAFAVVEGPSAGAGLGAAAAVGDVDQDGLEDVLVGAPYATSLATRGGLVGLLPAAGSLVGRVGWSSAAAMSVAGDDAGGYLGAAISVADIDADGTLDLALGAPGTTTSATAAGEVLLFLSPPATGALSSADADRFLRGASGGGALGTAVVVSEDHDGDGFSEVIAASPFATSGADTGAGAIWRWSVIPSFPDLDGDGFVAASAGGIDCDDADASVSPAEGEVPATGVDEDCDGWIDDAVVLRGDEDGWLWDLDAELGTTARDTYGFEEATAGDDVSGLYTGQGITLVPSGSLIAAAQAFGAAADGALGARIDDDGAVNALLLRFGEPIDALALRVLDPAAPLRVDAELDGEVLVEGVTVHLRADDLPGGALLGLTFAASVDQVLLTGTLADPIGVDSLEVVWAAGTDRDGDGLSDADGDCDDADPAVGPHAAEQLGNGVDDDCDGIVDGGTASVYADEAAWGAVAGGATGRIDFEALAPGELVELQYADQGVGFAGGVEVVTAVGASAPVDAQAGQGGAQIELSFREVQPAIAFQVLELQGVLRVQGYAGGVELYDEPVSVSAGSVAGGVFLGLHFGFGVDALVLTPDDPGADWGLDELRHWPLGLDDADGDGFTEAEGDCDDADAALSPDAVELWYDGIDQDCGEDDDYDADGDGHRAEIWGGSDCADADPERAPGAEELWYDGVDQDCLGDDDFDADGDGFRADFEGGGDCDDAAAAANPAATEAWYDGIDQDCAGDDDFDADRDGYAASGFGSGLFGGGDCDDGASSVSPGAEEIWYDGIDQDCGETGDFDKDGDGFDSAVYGGDDCNDLRADVYPGAPGERWYDGVDQDCDGGSDFDQDGDGHDADSYGGSDCDDGDPAVSPDAFDPPGDGRDDNCDGALEFDDDLDGHDDAARGGDDCDDRDPLISPSAAERWYDGVDQDCDGRSDGDADRDGEDAWVWGGGDCDDQDPGVRPGARDFPYDGVDADCGGGSDFDVDGDGHDVDWYGGDDCDDLDPDTHPGAPDAWYDGIDADCAGDDDLDADRDGWAGDGGPDCDDSDPTVNPAATELALDVVDQDCDGVDDVDLDGDGAWSAGDCDDADPDRAPGLPDPCGDGVDQDCDGDPGVDCDGDGHAAVREGGADCDDADPAVGPHAAERWYDGVDQDCGGDDDFDADGDGVAAAPGGADCDDGDPTRSPARADDPCGGGDEDCDGLVDEDCGADSGAPDSGGAEAGGEAAGDGAERPRPAPVDPWAGAAPAAGGGRASPPGCAHGELPQVGWGLVLAVAALRPRSPRRRREGGQ